MYGRNVGMPIGENLCGEMVGMGECIYGGNVSNKEKSVWGN